MSLNARTKGQEGEREIAKILNQIVGKVREQNGLGKLETRDELFQRNQNQSAVGGSDLTNPLFLEIEVKRQEVLSVNSWWKQCVESASRTKGIPILIYRQNRKAWRVMLHAEIPLFPEGYKRSLFLPECRVEIDIDTFKAWFKQYYQAWLNEHG